MDNVKRSSKIEKYMRDTSAKTVSLYNTAYRDGYEQGRIDWFDKGRESGYKDWNAHHEVIEEVKQAEFRKGMELAWTLARTIECMSLKQIKETFDTMDFDYIFRRFSVEEAVEKIGLFERIEALPEEDRVIIGDEMCYKDNKQRSFLISSITFDEDTDDIWLDGIGRNGLVIKHCNLKYVEKTGKHFDLYKILSEIGKPEVKEN